MARLLRFGFVPPPYGALWPQIRPLLEKAVAWGKNDWRDVGQALGDGRAQLWLATEDDKPVVAGVTRLWGDEIEVWLCGGKVLSGALPFLETVLAAAKEAGASRATIMGRVGWDRVLKDYGWRREGDELVKEFV